MKLIPCLFALVIAAGLVSGCGDPAPSTRLAPDKPAPDTSKLTPEQLAAAHDGSRPTDHR